METFAPTRAAVCIGINRAGDMTRLDAAAQGAREFAVWAKQQGCDTTLLVDDDLNGGRGSVGIADVFASIKSFVERGYDQLIVYFSGHGVLWAPGTEVWFLSGAPDNPNEAINLARSIEDARDAGIPHVVFVSDACRSFVGGPPLSRVMGGTVFPARPFAEVRAEIDVYYGTLPGDPAYEVSENEAATRYSGVFTTCLLDTVRSPEPVLVELVANDAVSRSVISSRTLKSHLETSVPVAAARLDIRIRQKPELRVETALPKYFAEVPQDARRTGQVSAVSTPRPAVTIESTLTSLRRMVDAEDEALLAFAERNGLAAQLRSAAERRPDLEPSTGFVVIGARVERLAVPGWSREQLSTERSDTSVIDLEEDLPPQVRGGDSILIEFDGGTGALLAIIPRFVGTIVVDGGRLTSVNYAPSKSSPLHDDYVAHAREIELMKAFAAVAARNGRFVVEEQNADALAGRIRQMKGLDPTLGLYAAYAYAQIGSQDNVRSVFAFMDGERSIPVPYDVAMLAARSAKVRRGWIAPFAPMLTQGWALLRPDNPLYVPIHGELRQHLLPSLWTTLDASGVALVRRAMQDKEVG